MHANSLELMERLIADHAGECKTVLDVGALDYNGTYREICESAGMEYTGADIEAGPNVDVILGEEWPGTKYDLVISGQTLEHSRRPWELMKKICGRARSRVVTIAPWSWEIHPYPVDCWRILPDGMRELITYAGWQTLSVGTSENDCFAVAMKG